MHFLPIRHWLSLAGLACALASAAGAEPRVALTTLPDRVRVEIDGALFTEYRFSGASKPYLYPVCAADGTRLTRDFPMAESASEERDHPHHRSLWFSHGSVNGHDFWAESPASGKIVHDAVLETRSGAVGSLRARNRWVAANGALICTDETVLRVIPLPRGRLLDYDVTIIAPPGSALTLGDTKEGTMALRVAGWMIMTQKAAGKRVAAAGHAVNSAGERDAAAWGRRARWVDYLAPHGGKIQGVAIFDHPENPHHPTWWHVRDYGLFAANPFGRHDFENLKDQPRAGEVVVPAGGRLRLRYRFYFHEGDAAAAGVAVRYEDYAVGR